MPARVDPPGQRLAGREHVIHRAVMDDRGRAVNLGQVDDAEAGSFSRLRGHLNGSMDEDSAVPSWGVLVVRDAGPGVEASAADSREQVLVERLDDRRDVLGLK